MGNRGLRALSALIVTVAMVGAASGPAWGQSPSGGGGDTPSIVPGAQSLESQLDDENEARLLALDNQYVSSRTAGDNPLTVEQAGTLRSAAAHAANDLKKAPPPSPSIFTGPWTGIGPNPIVQVARSSGGFEAVSGRIGALAIRQNGQFILGAAQGGIWTYDQTTKVWTNRTEGLPSLATGALAVAPSNDLVVYDGTGEGALSGDSYFGNGILKSTDGGFTWAHVSGDFFLGVSVARLAINPSNADHLYAAILRGRGGDRRVSPPIHSAYGLWESHDGGTSWTLIKPAPATSLGATDIRLDPQVPATLYSSFWGDAMYKSTDGGATWTPIMNGLPANADFSAVPTRFSIGISHPSGAAQATLYTGFDWVDTTTHKRQAGRIFKSTDGGAHWTPVSTGTGPFDTVLDYCTTQCFYDNVVEPDPTNPNVVFVAGSFGYSMPIQSGGIFRSDDGGATWRNIGWDLHPDFHALAFDPKNSSNVLIGNDGGVWYSTSRGGRTAAETAPCTASTCLKNVTWQDLNGTVNPATAGVTHRTNLQITQFTSIGTNPSFPDVGGGPGARIWGGSQDNGTERKSATSNTWFDLAGGDGGQVLVDPTDFSYVYGTYFGISPYRMTDGGAGFFTNQFITNGINPSDRSEFYTPFVLNQNNVNQLFLGTYRLYRTDNAKAASVGDVKWNAISPDLTTGCTGTSPNGARNCTISAIGVGGGTAVYTGSLDGLVYFSADAQVNNNPTWTRVGVHSNGVGDKHTLPGRPVAWIAVDRSNYRTAYLAYNGYSASTPHQPGHVYKTTDAGQSWTDISGNLPDNPVNSLILDPSFPNTLYAATDVGPFVTNNGGASWAALGTNFPTVAVDQLDLDPSNGILAAGTHGKGAYRIDASIKSPALVISKADAGVPVGPGSNLKYTITLRNIGSADATGVTITDPIPANTSFVSAQDGGSGGGGSVTWSGKSVPAGGSIAVHFTVNINPGVSSSVTSVTDDGYGATDAQGQSVSGSPTVTKFAPPYAVSLSPSAQTGGAHSGQSQTYTVTVTNQGFKTDSYTLSASGGTFAATIYDATCTTPTSTTTSIVAGATATFCVKVAAPAGATDGTSSTSTVTATSAGSPTTSASATIKTIAVTVDTLLVDEDGNAPDVRSFYTGALTTAGVAFDTWDLNADPNLPVKYMEAFKNIFWFTGTSYPAPIQPYEGSLSAYLANGGRLFLSGQDILDQGAGTTPFVSTYLHVRWDGSENQNDRLSNSVTGVAGNSVTNGIGSVPLDLSILGGAGLAFMDQITPINGAQAAFMDDGSNTKPAVGSGPQPDALTFSGGGYKVVFLAFPFEEYGSAGQKSDLVTRVINFFNAP